MEEKVKFVRTSLRARYRTGDRGIVVGFCFKDDLPHAIVRKEAYYIVAPLSHIEYTG